MDDITIQAFKAYIKQKLTESEGDHDMLFIFSAVEGGVASNLSETYEDVGASASFDVPEVVAEALEELACGSCFNFQIDLGMFKTKTIKLD